MTATSPDAPIRPPRVTVVLLVREVGDPFAEVLAEIAVAGRDLPGIGILALDRSAHGELTAAIEALAVRHGLPCEVIAAPAVDGASLPEPWGIVWAGVVHAARSTAGHGDDHTAPDLIVTLDPDGHHDARALPVLVTSAVRHRYGVTIGSRWAPGGSAPATPLPRRLVSRLAARLIGVWSGVPRVHDITSSLRVVRSDVVAATDGEPVAHGAYAQYAEFVAVARALGFVIGEVPIEFRPRHSPVPSLSGRDLVMFAADLVRVRRRVAAVRARMRSDQTDWSERCAAPRHQAFAAEFGAVDELMTLAGAANFTRWIVEQFEGAIGADVLEVGAGLGAVTRCIAERHPTVTVTALEPAPNLIDGLRRELAHLPRVSVGAATSGTWLDEGPRRRYDTVVYVNVLEHIRDDVAELRIAHELLRPGGHLCVFVPALPRLYGSLDRISGHYRRYTERRLTEVVTGAGFEIVRSHHLDALGVMPYWMLYRVFGVRHLGRGTSRLYDSVLVPVGRALERRPPPFGKNLVVVARRA